MGEARGREWAAMLPVGRPCAGGPFLCAAAHLCLRLFTIPSRSSEDAIGNSMRVAARRNARRARRPFLPRPFLPPQFLSSFPIPSLLLPSLPRPYLPFPSRTWAFLPP